MSSLTLRKLSGWDLYAHRYGPFTIEKQLVIASYSNKMFVSV
jgi:hypothetical protein